MYKEIVNDLITLYNKLAPTGKEQAALVRLIHQMQFAGESNKDIVVTILHIMIDGIKENQWPK